MMLLGFRSGSSINRTPIDPINVLHHFLDSLLSFILCATGPFHIHDVFIAHSVLLIEIFSTYLSYLSFYLALEGVLKS